MKRPDAVIFDFDGVLFDTEPLHGRAFAAALAPRGIQLTEATYFAKFVGLNDREIFTRLQAEHSILRPIDSASFLSEKNEAYLNITREGCRPIDGVESFLGRLRRSETPIAICSGSRRADITRLLERAGLAPYFETIVSADDVERSKPDPQGYRLAFDLLRRARPSLRTERSVVIEDSGAGILAARAAGMPVVVLRSDRSAPVIPQGVVEIWNYVELTEQRLSDLI